MGSTALHSKRVSPHLPGGAQQKHSGDDAVCVLPEIAPRNVGGRLSCRGRVRALVCPEHVHSQQHNHKRAKLVVRCAQVLAALSLNVQEDQQDPQEGEHRGCLVGCIQR